MSAPAVDVAVPEPRGLRAWLARADDRLNPILVKEIRQALRGRYFRNLFWLTVVLATGIGVFMILISSVDNDLDRLGPHFFSATFGVLSFAVHTFVPFWAFQSMGAEWEENTFDLLVISDLRPRQMIVGKVLAAATQALLYYCAFSPFLVSTFLMGGVDILAIAVILPLSMLVSTTLSFLAVALSTLGKTKIARAGLAMLLACALLPVSGGGIAFATMLVEQSSILRDHDFLFGLAMFVSALPIFAFFMYSIGCARLAHDEENHSTALRILVTAINLVSLGWGIYAYTTFSYRDEGWLEGMVAFGFGISFLAYLFFVTEPETFGRRVAKQVPRSSWLALHTLPWFPGGGRGLLLLLANGALAVFVTAAAALPLGDADAVMFVAALYLYGAVSLGLLSGIASFGVRTLRARNAVRIGTLVLLGLTVFLPALGGFLFDITEWMKFEHPLNPFWILSEIASGRTSTVSKGLLVLGAGILLTLAANFARILRALDETSRCSAERREREAKATPTDAATQS
ncbi:MAG: hypothetical protein K8S98_13825 [Planctomycetes bacterium]|nr:hypothetical protein [Planctomycetota bacterium]